MLFALLLNCNEPVAVISGARLIIIVMLRLTRMSFA